ncbi:MAG TPA: glucose-6-phosphate isomerase [Xanthobacteraceae bacterium]|nr:glucose-6-phosphate isomerase [Xanthobacteraceae bacterium]
MPIVQSIDNALADRINGGIPKNSFEAALANTANALDWLRARHANGGLPLLNLPDRREDLDAILTVAEKFRVEASDIVFMGTGGSSLGGQTLAQLAGHAVPGLGLLRDGPRLHFLDNLDPVTFADVLARLPLSDTRFISISKSGGTAETLMQTSAVLEALSGAGLSRDIPQLFLGLSEPAVPGKRNGLRALLEAYDVAFLEHDTKVGGRFSVLTNVGLLAAAMAGLDIAAVRAGAANALAPVLMKKPPKDVPAAVGAALAFSGAQAGKTISVLMAYADRLERFTRWYVQLWAESLGKEGHGTTPVAALGPVDQHSQQQLFIAGPRDKLITVVTVATAGEGPRIEQKFATLAGEPDFSGKSVGDLVAAQSRAMVETFARNGVAVRTLHLETLDEASMGELLMHFMLETIITSQLMEIDAFDQPAVEEAKVLAKKYLAGK